MTLRVRQTMQDTTLGPEQVAELSAGDFVGDGMSHGNGIWTWTRNTVVANDREAQVIVVSYGDEPYGAPTCAYSYDEAAHLWCRWSDVSDRRSCEHEQARCEFVS